MLVLTIGHSFTQRPINPQLATIYPEYLKVSSDTSRAGMTPRNTGALHIGAAAAADNTTIHSVSSIRSPNYGRRYSNDPLHIPFRVSIVI